MRHVYGPVASGRLGRSLGVDPFLGVKTCNFDCTYCQLGSGDPAGRGPTRSADVDEVVEQARRAMAAETEAVDWVTISGAGEPTLHPELGMMIDGLRRVTATPIAVVTNGSRLHRREVREALSGADAVLPTLAAAEPGVHWLMHRPRGLGAFRRHVEGLREFRESYRGRFWLEVMLVAGVNDDREHLKALARLVRRIRPDEVHITRPTRPGAESWVTEPTFAALIRATAALHGVVVRPGRAVPAGGRAHDDEGVLEAIEGALRRRPLREREVLSWLEHAGVDEPAAALDRLVARGGVRRVARESGAFLVPARVGADFEVRR